MIPYSTADHGAQTFNYPLRPDSWRSILAPYQSQVVHQACKNIISYTQFNNDYINLTLSTSHILHFFSGAEQLILSSSSCWFTDKVIPTGLDEKTSYKHTPPGNMEVFVASPIRAHSSLIPQTRDHHPIRHPPLAEKHFETLTKSKATYNLSLLR